MEMKDIEFVKTNKIGWKACKYLEHGLAIVKLEIDPRDVFSDPVIRKHKFNTGFYKVCSDKEARLITNPYGNYDLMMDNIKIRMENYIRSHGINIYKTTTDITMLGLENEIEMDDTLHHMKCRCAKAKVLKINAIDDPSAYVISRAMSLYDNCFVYRTGDIVKPSNMDEFEPHFDRLPMNICGPGIHYFEDWRAALLYGAIDLDRSVTIEYLYKLLFGNEIIFLETR